MTIRPYSPADRAEWQRMRSALWPDQTVADMEAFLAREASQVLVVERPLGGLCGFAEVAVRSVADGCRTAPVAYLEGWYVDADVRRRGCGAALIAAVVQWSRARGMCELGSDTELQNLASQRAHLHTGFTEVGRVVQFRKDLNP